MQEDFFKKFLHNNLFTGYTLEVDFPQTYDFEHTRQEAQNALNSIITLYDTKKFQSQNEHQFEDDFITKVLEILGWEFVRQDEKIIQGKTEKPDFLLFATKDSKTAYQNIAKKERQSSNEYFSVVLESKAYNLEIDNKKILNNPHFQLLRYLNNLKKDYGFLTNGRSWRFYDNSKLSATKIFYEVNLEAILQMRYQHEQLESFLYFYHIFHANNFCIKKQKPTIAYTLEKNDESKALIEDDLQSLIYGTEGKDSVFEKIGALIHAANPDSPLQEVYENALYFTFRLLFIAYFEDKFDEVLDKHFYFKDEISLYLLLSSPIKQDNQKLYKLIGKLEDIFRIYNEGKDHYDMPIFNGGLFDPNKTPLLSVSKAFSDKDLYEILDKLFHFQDGTKTYRRDYRTLSISHLGTIYEGLLSFFFAIADEDIVYIVYEPKSLKAQKSLDNQKSIEAYFDSYDYAALQKDSIIHHVQSYKKGQIYLKNTSNSRKASASFYTPESITKFLVESSLEDSLSDSNILHFKILDNACGSGHFLVESLNHITKLVLEKFAEFPTLKKFFEQEKKEILQNIAQYVGDSQIDESDILKRLLLKRIIFGVDLNPFSVELTKLSLWIDSFIFGTPLSFIEHHIKCGNALIGTTIKDFKNYYHTLQETMSKQKGQNAGQSLFIDSFLNEFNVLSNVFEKLDSIKDNTESDIKESKRIYTHEISPILEKLNLFLNLYNAKHFMNKTQLQEVAKLESDSIENLVDSKNKEWDSLRSTIQSLTKQYRFFNYEIEFPEIVSNNEFVGFQTIVGNPPWNKSEFSDNDFFPQLMSNYRTLSKSKKEEIRINYLAKSYIKKDYDKEKEFIAQCNEYYKIYYPFNRIGKDINLFRLFVERNLSLLESNRTLNYVLPSALMLEEGSVALRKEILEHSTLEYFYSLENRAKIFKDVDSRYKFALMQIRKTKPTKTHRIKTMFYKTSIAELYKKSNIIRVTLKKIKDLSPQQFALQEVHSNFDLEILNKCYKRFKPLNLEWLDFRNELNMTTDRDLFIEPQLNFEPDAAFSKDDLLPLYEGKMIHQYHAKFQSPQYFLEPNAFDEAIKNKEVYRLKQDLGLDSKEYHKLLESMLDTNTTKEQLEDSLIIYDRNFIRLGFRGIASDTNERTAIFSLLPKNIGCGHSLYVNTPKKYILEQDTISYQPISHIRILFALGIFNSLVVDFIVRRMVQINVSKTYLQRIPLPQPSDSEITESPLYNSIALNALRLQLYHDKQGYFTELAHEFNLQKSEIPKTQKAYDTLKAKLDITIAKDVYTIERQEFFDMLETFKVLQTKQSHYVALLKTLWEET